MKAFSRLLNQFLMSPKAVVMVCLVVGASGILLDGTLYRIWNLKNEKISMENKIQEAQTRLQKLRAQIQMAHDPKFIEREARNRFDLVNKDDIVFVFAEE